MKHLISIDDLSAQDIVNILDKAEKHVEKNRQKDKSQEILKGRTIINLFFEDSTRTRTSFELAGKRLGADVVNMSIATSSLKKGETLLDTAMTLNAMRPDFIIMRHGESGAVHLLAKKVECSMINAGDGTNEHPTQALLDASTIRSKKGGIKDLNIAICGDILHSRVARSNIKLLGKMGANTRIIAPPTLIPSQIEKMGVRAFTNMKEGLKDVDVIMMLRLQKERMNNCFIPSEREYFKFYGLDKQKLKYAKDDAIIMHPGPMNRGVEIDSDLADHKSKSVILAQVEMGVAVRQAVLEMLA